MVNHISFSIVNVCKPSHVYWVGGGRLVRPCSQTLLCISEQYSWLAHLVIYEFDMFCTLWLAINYNHVYSARYFTVNQWRAVLFWFAILCTLWLTIGYLWLWYDRYHMSNQLRAEGSRLYFYGSL